MARELDKNAEGKTLVPQRPYPGLATHRVEWPCLLSALWGADLRDSLSVECGGFPISPNTVGVLTGGIKYDYVIMQLCSHWELLFRRHHLGWCIPSSPGQGGSTPPMRVGFSVGKALSTFENRIGVVRGHSISFQSRFCLDSGTFYLALFSTPVCLK